VLLVHHTYGRLNWELPGGGAEGSEGPDETAVRELFEETGLRAELDHLSGVYLETDADHGQMLHFVFRFRWREGLVPVASSPEVSEVRYWPLDGLPRPISDFTERRIHDAAVAGPIRVEAFTGRHWRE